MSYGAKQIHGPENRVISVAQGVKNANGYCPSGCLIQIVVRVSTALYTLSAAGRKGFLSGNGKDEPEREPIDNRETANRVQSVFEANDLDKRPTMLTGECFQISASVHDDVETVA
jgi:hypothetical protein